MRPGLAPARDNLSMWERPPGSVAAPPLYRSGRWRAGFVVTLAVMTAFLDCRHQSDRARPNVILVTFDTLRADFLGCYGDSVTRTPTLDALAAQGVLFEWAFATAPFTSTSIWSILYSEQVHNHTYSTLINEQYGKRGSIAARFRQAGYLAVGVSGSSVLDAASGYAQGFDLYLDTYAEHSLNNETTLRRIQGLSDSILMSSARQRPLFLYVHFFDPHTPWGDAPAAFRVYPPRQGRFAEVAFRAGVFRRANNFETARADNAVRTYSSIKDTDRLKKTGKYEEYPDPMYRSEITWSDNVLKRFLRGLRREGLLENAVIAVAADHGVAFAEHYQVSGYAFSLFNEAIRVPLIITGPGLNPRRVVTPVSLVDLAPTLLDLAGISSNHADGTSFRGLIEGRGIGRPAYAETTALLPDLLSAFFGDGRSRYAAGTENVHAMLVEDNLKIIHMPAREGAKFELFDVRADPGETHNIYSEQDPSHRAMSERLLKREQRNVQSGGTSLDPDAVERLRALGYVK